MPRKPRFGRIFRRKYNGQESGPWWIEYYIQGHQERESAKSDRFGDAERLLKHRLMDIETGSYSPLEKKITVATLLDGLLAEYEANEKSIIWARNVDGHLRPFFGWMKASRVETRDIQKYVSQRRRAGVKNSTIARELALLRRAFNLGREETPPLITRAPNFPKLKEPPARKGFFEYEEFTALRAELPEHLRPSHHVCLLHRVPQRRDPDAVLGTGRFRGPSGSSGTGYNQE